MISIAGTDKKIGGDDVFIVAEIGKNFIDKPEAESVDVYIEKAKKLIDAAADSGVDAVKFQTHEVEDEVADIPFESAHFQGAKRFDWVKRNTEATPSRFWREIKQYAEKKDLVFFSTPMSRSAAQKLMKVGVPLWKIGSGDILDFILLDFIVQTKKPVIISTGMVSKEELRRVVTFLQEKNIPTIILYAVSKYPCPPNDFNLASLDYLRETYPEAVIGFSDHSIEGDAPSLTAVGKGAKIIEKHFSFSRGLWGADHASSLTPPEMERLVKAIRGRTYEGINKSEFQGLKEKEFEGARNQFRSYFHKSLVAAGNIKKGEKITKEDVYALRPQSLLGGLPSERFYDIVGKIAKRNIVKNQSLSEKDFG